MDEIEHLAPPFYIRWTSGPDYEQAFLCVDDGDADMRDFAEVSFGMARLFKAGLAAALKARDSDEVVDATNAHLIHAAPDMFAALHAVKPECGLGCRGEYDDGRCGLGAGMPCCTVRAAIAKATGEA